ncbi:hypothetical protein [Paenibacillus larvae]|uniref:hypothetical protein n=1 Tax=Paenibacillus larvae TaxID=1464 RepID=UPI002892636A|nr:hypothetical protein [Paenibacillus larvae]MDT2193209.1 hypothetical protein [Paenibacillus larvae]
MIKWKNQLLRSGFLSYKDAWLLDRFSVGSGGRTIKTDLSLPGGAFGPSVLYFTNEPKKYIPLRKSPFFIKRKGACQ